MSEIIVPRPVPDSVSVSAGLGLKWLGDGWRMFTKAPMVWLLIAVIASTLHVLAITLPLIGVLLGALFLGGVMTACAAAGEGPVRIAALFCGIRNNLAGLLVLGIVCLVLFAIVTIITWGTLFIFGGGILVSTLIQSATLPPDEIVASLTGIVARFLVAILLTLLVAAIFLILLAIVIWFAPALIVLRGVTPMQAMRSSFTACLRNWQPFSAYVLAVLVLMAIATTPVMFGYIFLIPVLMMILIPVLLGSMYASYRDIYC